MTIQATKKMTCIGWMGVVAALLLLPMCGGEATDETGASEEGAEAAAVEAPMSNEELAAVTQEFELEAEAQINEENLEEEVAKIEAEIQADK